LTISIFKQGVSYEFPKEDIVFSWVEDTIHREGKTCGEISFILCGDEYLRELNLKYLNHDYFTDVITFDYSSGKEVSGDVFVSLDRVRDNATELEESLTNELHRVMIHGILHLCGYRDKSDAERSQMREKEDYYLSLRSF